MLNKYQMEIVMRKHDEIIKAMKGACPGCRVGIMPFGKSVSLSWVGKQGTHREPILRDGLVIGGVEFENALARAKEAMNVN